ncbi:MAG TPA: TolC family protein [Saprospiraceae bacterium]|nr:TolC family protein [Saprospiraceae bacterium]
MKLVNIHILYLLVVLFVIGFQRTQAQVWSMQQCIDTAQVYNKSLQMSKNNILIGEQKEKEVKANLMPRIMVNTDYKYFTNLPNQLLPLSTFNPAAPDGQFKAAKFGVPHNINANVLLTMPLYNAQMYGAIQTTIIASELTEIQYQKTEEQIYFDISNIYYNAQILHHQMAFIDSNLINAQRLLNNIQLLKEQLLAKGTDVSKIKLQVAQLTTQKESIQSKYEQVLNALKFSMGISVALNLEIDPKITYLPTNEYTPASTVDIRMVKTQNRLLLSEINTLKKSIYLPSLNLLASYGTSGFGYRSELNSFLDFYPVGFVGIQLSYPLFDGKITQRKINQKTMELQNNEMQNTLLTEQNIMQVENLKLQRKVSSRSVETTTKQIELAKTIYEQTNLQQKQGIATLTDVLLADNALREAQQAYLNAVIDYLKSDLELKKITGNIAVTNKTY